MKKIDATGLFVWKGKVAGYHGDSFLVTTETNSAVAAACKLKTAARRIG